MPRILRPQLIFYRSYWKREPRSVAEPYRDKFLKYQSGELPTTSDKPEFPPLIPPEGDRSVEREKYEEKLRRQEVESFETLEERLYFLNPFERTHSIPEDKWHRPWHPPQIRPRHAYRLFTPPKMYNSLPFYSYVTNTDVQPLTNAHFSDELPDDVLENIMASLKNRKAPFALTSRGTGQPDYRDVHQQREFERMTKQQSNGLLQLMTGVVLEECAGVMPGLEEAQVAHDARVESYWIRSGYRRHYPTDEEEIYEKREDLKEGNFYKWDYDFYKYFRMTGDTIDKRGQLAFCHRGDVAVQIRHAYPLAPVQPWEGSEPNTSEPIPAYDHYPGLFYEPNTKPLYMVPGYEFGDKSEFTSTLCLSLPHLYTENLQRWFPYADQGGYGMTESDTNDYVVERENAIASTLIGTCFSTLLGAAHFCGFTQHHDLTYPLTVNAIVALDLDRYEYRFAKYQLNTIDFAHDWRIPDRQNNLWISDPIYLRNMETTEEGVQPEWELNADFIRKFAEFVTMVPEIMEMELRPYFPKKVEKIVEEDVIVAKYADL